MVLCEPRDAAELTRRIREAREAKQRDRLRAVELAIAGQPTLAIMAMLGRSRRFVQRWCCVYRDQGLDAVAPRKPPGRPPITLIRPPRPTSTLTKPTPVNNPGYTFSTRGISPDAPADSAASDVGSDQPQPDVSIEARAEQFRHYVAVFFHSDRPNRHEKWSIGSGEAHGRAKLGFACGAIEEEGAYTEPGPAPTTDNAIQPTFAGGAHDGSLILFDLVPSE